jgi:hypothetical protein
MGMFFKYINQTQGVYTPIIMDMLNYVKSLLSQGSTPGIELMKSDLRFAQNS